MKKTLVEDVRVVGKSTIFSIDYLQNAELTDEDLIALFKKSNFVKSIIVGMFDYENIQCSVENILNDISKDNQWIHRHSWTPSRRKSFEKILINIYKNIYCYGDAVATSKAQWFTTIYGFDVKSYRKRH